MAQIKDILSIKLEDDIKSVINLNSQSEEDILEELDGFILTESLSKHLSDFCDLFGSGTKQSGLWLSGFYGSGKSYFSKMMGMLLSNRTIVGTPMRQRFMPKLQGLKDADILQNSIEAMGRTRNHVVLFDSAKETGEHGIAYMMMAAFLRSLGFMDNWIGFWEYDIYINGQYNDFLKKVSECSGSSWIEVRKSMQKVIPAFKKAIKAIGVDDENYIETKKLIEGHIVNYDANKLGADLQRYLDKNADTRVIFMVDEVSEAISQGKINLLDLEGVSETLADTAQRVWTIAIAQQRLDDVISSTNLNKDKLTKLIDRFKNRIDIKAEEVETIIRHRLLAKTDEGNNKLKAYFDKNSGMIGDITNINATNLKKTTSAQTYANYYPFFEHQFKMLQYFLFGTQNMVRTQVGTRGMLISAFDILKKEAVKEEDVFVHVNAAQLCRQAEDNVSESLNNRYLQADGLIKEPEYKWVRGHDLLQTIHFLTQAEVIQTTAENIAKSYVCKPDEYYSVKAEVIKALEQLTDANILIYTGNQYRITSEIEQRIINDLNSFDIPSYRIKSEAVKVIKNLTITRKAARCVVDAFQVDYTVKMNGDELLWGNQNGQLNIVFHDIFSVQTDPTAYLERIKDETQSAKNVVSLIPEVTYANDIWKLIDALSRMKDLENKTYSTTEEKNVQNRILSTKEEKNTQLGQLVANAYTHGTVVYCYNTSLLNDDNYNNLLDGIQRQMYNNIYTRRLSSQLSDALAPKVLRTAEMQLKNLFTQEDFKFFDTSGRFIGEQLCVVTELMGVMKNYIVGIDLERILSAPPTGYEYGTIVTTLAVLYRANKIIVKYGGVEYHSFNEVDSHIVFSNSKQFQKASFKAVAKSLTYNDRRDIVDTLKDDCHYQKWTGEQVNYKMNDYELVDAIRTLSREVMSRITNEIIGDTDMEQKFHRSVAARNVLAQYSSAVTDNNYYATAKLFLEANNNDDYISAIACADKDLKFIKEGLPAIKEELSFIEKVEDELDKSSCAKLAFDSLKTSFIQMYEINIVANATNMVQITQQVKDLYYQLMKHYAEEMTTGYIDLQVELDHLKGKLEVYPKAWNVRLYNQIADMVTVCEKNRVHQIELKGFSTQCAKSGFMLRDMVYAINQLEGLKNKLVIMETEIVTSDPTPAPQPAPGSNKPIHQPPLSQPMVRKMKQKLPSGKLTVDEYRRWLKAQLTMVGGFGASDSLDFDN